MRPPWPFSGITPKAVNPYSDPADAVLSSLNLISALQDNEQEQLRREALSEEVWGTLFLHESLILSSAKWCRTG